MPTILSRPTTSPPTVTLPPLTLGNADGLYLKGGGSLMSGLALSAEERYEVSLRHAQYYLEVPSAS